MNKEELKERMNSISNTMDQMDTTLATMQEQLDRLSRSVLNVIKR